MGTGMIGEHHARAIAANAEKGAHLVAMGHYNQARFAEIEHRFGVPCMLEQELLLNPAVDVVCICTPSGQHSEQAIRAAEAGKHVLVEKPMAISMANADAMIAACQKNQVTLGVAFPNRTKPLFQEIHRSIRSGQLGDLTLGLANIPFHRPQSYYNQAKWRGTWALDGGGVLMNQGIHLIDLLAWYMGDPVEVRAFAHTLHQQIEVEDTLSASLRFKNGALAAINATTTASPGFPPRIEIYGTRGGVQVEGDLPVRWMLDGQAASSNSYSAQIGVSQPRQSTSVPAAGPGANPRSISTDGHTALVRDFIDAVRDHRPPLVDGAEGKRSLAIILAIYQAAGLVNPTRRSKADFESQHPATANPPE